MASTSETAAFALRTSVNSFWSTRRSHRAGAATPTPAQNGTTAATTKSGGGGGGPHGGVNPGRARDEQAEMWGAEVSAGVGAGRGVVKAADKDEELRRRILGKRRREAPAGGKGQGGGAGGGDGAESDEEVGRSAVGRKKRAVRVERPREREVEDEGGEMDVSPAEEGGGSMGAGGIKSPEAAAAVEAGAPVESQAVSSEELEEDEAAKRRRKNRNRKKKRKAAASA